MPNPALHRRKRNDRLTAPDRVQVENEIAVDHIVGVYTRRKEAADQKWGTDRLPEIVGTDLAFKYGKAVESFERAMMRETLDPVEIQGRVDNLVKGLNALDVAAEKAGCERAPDGCIAIRVGGKPGVIVWDIAAMAHVRKQQPTATIYTIEEIERLLAADAMKLVTLAKEHFDGAKIVELRKPTFTEKLLDDEIPF